MIYHVHTGINGGWVTRREGAVKASMHFRTRSEALTYARKRPDWLEIVVHRTDGTVIWIQTRETERHNTAIGALDCWCDPKFYKPCDEGDTGCWKCKDGLIRLTREEAEAENGGLVIVHNE